VRPDTATGLILGLSITSRMLCVELDGSRRIWPAHVGCPVDPDGLRRIQKDLWMIIKMIKGHPKQNRMIRRCDESRPRANQAQTGAVAWTLVPFNIPTRRCGWTLGAMGRVVAPS
jgi:hypothetical protein